MINLVLVCPLHELLVLPIFCFYLAEVGDVYKVGMCVKETVPNGEIGRSGEYV